MKLIEEIYEEYKGKLTGDDEDIDALTFGVLQAMTRQDILELLEELSNEELKGLFGLYVMESLRSRFADDGAFYH
ncbi:DUF6154 family protein [Bacillus fonticola]|uniref:DUF6154 family protein n=1 Tax=Bacillus fonticola TaxID=2728853 RepID=UPI0014737F2A|nr:DUF6154 family protein [Bacillus fonticola]